MPDARSRNKLLAAALWASILVSACHASDQATPGLKSTGRPGSQVKTLIDKARRSMRFVQGGTFQMGDFGPIDSPEKLPYSPFEDNKVLHKVALESFSISAYKTTYADLDVYSEATGQPKFGTDESTLTFRYPQAAGGLDWQHAHSYCQWLGGLLGVPMDLPTEAQWEYAARNRGQMVLYATDNGKVEAGRNVWAYQQRLDYIEKNKLNAYSPSLPLGQFPATPLGLHDLMTDGYEWTLDWYDANGYATAPVQNPSGPVSGTERVLRSFPSRDGAGLSMGDGMTVARSHREPSPKSVNLFSGKAEPGHNMTADTTARCVANVSSPLN